MTKRVMIARELNKRWKLPRTDIFGAFTARRERTSGRQMRQVRRLTRNLIELALFRSRIGNGTQQPARVGIARTLKQLGGGRLLENLAGIHHDNVIGHAGDDAQVMRDQNHARACLTFQFLYEFENLRLNRDIQCGGRLVRNQQLRLARKRHRDHHALAHAA